MKVRFSPLAGYKLEKLSAYLVSEWSERSNIKFLRGIDSKIKAIEANPQLYPKSELQPSL